MRSIQTTDDVNFIESLLDRVTLTNHLRDILLDISPGTYFCRIEGMHGFSGYVHLLCKDYVDLSIRRNEELALFKHVMDQNDDAQVGRKTIISFRMEQPSNPRNQASLGKVVVETVDMLLQATFASYELQLEEELRGVR